MSIQLYECAYGHKFEFSIPVKDAIPQLTACIKCDRDAMGLVPARWRPPTGTSFIIKDGGTGAQKGSR